MKKILTFSILALYAVMPTAMLQAKTSSHSSHSSRRDSSKRDSSKKDQRSHHKPSRSSRHSSSHHSSSHSSSRHGHKPQQQERLSEAKITVVPKVLKQFGNKPILVAKAICYNILPGKNATIEIAETKKGLVDVKLHGFKKTSPIYKNIRIALKDAIKRHHQVYHTPKPS